MTCNAQPGQAQCRAGRSGRSGLEGTRAAQVGSDGTFPGIPWPLPRWEAEAQDVASGEATNHGAITCPCTANVMGERRCHG